MNLEQAAETLLKGTAVEALRPAGNSMSPIIKSKQAVTIQPIIDPAALTKGDIVLVRVSGHIYLHFIKAAQSGNVQIGNSHGRINGWTQRQNVYGIVTAIEGLAKRNSQYKHNL